MDPAPLTHIAVIMDGNGRWAEARHLPRTAGHKKGAETARAILRSAGELGVKYLTMYAFSNENWQRPKLEVAALMQLLKHYLKTEIKELMDNDVRFTVIGDRSQLDSDIVKMIENMEQKSIDNQGIHLQLALSYGSRQELVRVCNALKHKEGEVTEADVESALYTSGVPDPDLLIRTGGEERISNFLLWQMAYTELYFTEILWPDFTADDFKAAITDFYARERRFGRIAGEKEAG